MSFNKNACKRLSAVVGINRCSREIIGLVDHLAREYLERLLERLIQVVLFAGRKTILVDDVRFLSRICPTEQPMVACAGNLAELVSKNNVDGYITFTLKKPFEELAREILHNSEDGEEIRLGKNVVILLQCMTEQYIIKTMSSASSYMIASGRDTLLARDFLQIHPNPNQFFKSMRSW